MRVLALSAKTGYGMDDLMDLLRTSRYQALVVGAPA